MTLLLGFVYRGLRVEFEEVLFILMMDDKEECPNTLGRFITLRRVIEEVHRDWTRFPQ